MKIAIDVSCIEKDKAGIGYYTEELTKALILEGRVNKYTLISNSKASFEGFKFQDGSNCDSVVIESNRPNFFWIWNVSNFLKKEKFDLLISPSYFSFGILFKNTLQIIHDLVPIKHPEFLSWKSVAMFKFLLKIEVERSKLFACNSNATMSDLNSHFPKTKDKSFVIGGGLHTWVWENYQNTSITKPGSVGGIKIPEKYFLTLGTLQPRKNHVNMIKAFANFAKENPDYFFLIGGKKGWFYDEIFEEVKKHGLEDKVLFLGYVDEKFLPGLLRYSASFVYTSKDEGFVLPCIEAYAMGTNVIVSDISVMKEFLEDKVEYVNPDDISTLTAIMKKNAIKIKSTVDIDFLNKFTWNSSARKIIEKLQHFS